MNERITKILILLAVVVLQSCSSTPIVPTKKKVTKSKSSLYGKLGNFDKVYIPNKAPIIAEMISVVQPELDFNIRNKVASDISVAIAKHNIEPQIMVALIDTESNFKHTKISSTGDVSIAQVNVEVWNKEFARLGLPLIKKSELTKKDQSYAMMVMAKILSILKSRHAKSDRRWYARYHSNTTKYKHDYLKKIEIRMKLLSQSRNIAMR